MSIFTRKREHRDRVFNMIKNLSRDDFNYIDSDVRTFRLKCSDIDYLGATRMLDGEILHTIRFSDNICFHDLCNLYTHNYTESVEVVLDAEAYEKFRSNIVSFEYAEIKCHYLFAKLKLDFVNELNWLNVNYELPCPTNDQSFYIARCDFSSIVPEDNLPALKYEFDDKDIDAFVARIRERLIENYIDVKYR